GRARVEPGDLEPAGADVGSRGGRVGEGDAEGVLDPGLEIEYADGVPLDGEIADRGIEADALADRGGTEFERGIGGARGLDEGQRRERRDIGRGEFEPALDRGVAGPGEVAGDGVGAHRETQAVEAALLARDGDVARERDLVPVEIALAGERTGDVAVRNRAVEGEGEAGDGTLQQRALIHGGLEGDGDRPAGPGGAAFGGHFARGLREDEAD